MCREMLTQHALFVLGGINAKKRDAESAFCDACRTSSGICCFADLFFSLQCSKRRDCCMPIIVMQE